MPQAPIQPSSQPVAPTQNGAGVLATNPPAPQATAPTFFGVDPTQISDPQGQTFYKAWTNAQQNPDSPLASAFIQNVKSGKYNQMAQSAGIPIGNFPNIFPGPNLGQRLVSDTEGHAGNIVEDFSDQSQAPSTAALDILGNVAGEAGDIIGEPLKSLYSKLPPDAQQTLSQGVQGLVKMIANTKTPDALLNGGNETLGTAFTKLQAQNPVAMKDAGNVAQIISLMAGGEGAQPAADAATQGVGDVAHGISSAVGGVAQEARDALAGGASTPESDLARITDAIAPQMNSAEMKSAIAEGRIARADQGFLSEKLFGQAPDVVTQSDEVQQAANTIQKNIPGAAQMNDAQLYTALDKSIATNAKALKPVMESVPVDLETLGKAKDAWAALKAQQVSDVGASFDNMPGATKMQNDFQNVMDSLNKGSIGEDGKFQPATANTMNDIWEARKAYDQSIPTNVKEASSISSDALQYKKAMWLQNRGILNAMINDTTSGLGDTSKQAFSDMSDMYTAQQNLIGKAPKPELGGEGLIGKGGKFSLGTTAKNAAKYGGGAWIGGSILKDIL